MSDRASRIARLGFDYPATEKHSRRACDLCGSDRFVVVSSIDRYGYPAQASSCLVCGLTFLDPVMTPDAYADFYRSVYRPLVTAYHGRRIDAITIKDEQREYAAERIEFMVPLVGGRSDRTFLDVGGSTGVVASALRDAFGWKPTVLDPAPLELDEAAKLHIETISGFIEDYEPGGRTFDVVGMFQTVDHLLGAASALAKIRSLVRDGGWFYADIVDWRAAYLRNRSIEAAVKVDHPYYFTEPTFEAMLVRSGFEIVRKHYARDHLHIGYWTVAGARQPDALPGPEHVRAHFAEIRAIQNGG